MRHTAKFLYTFILRKKIYSVFSSILATGFILMLLSSKDGPAKNGNTNTGAPFNNNKDCSECHSGGDFGSSIQTQLLDPSSGSAVTGYAPNKSYNFRITLNHTTGTPLSYGFQTSVARTVANININRWGTLPANTQNTLKSGRNYVEHSSPLLSNVITIPWTAPTAGTGTVVFYTGGNVTNDNNKDTGDDPANTSLTVTEGEVLPISLLYFKGSLQNGKAILIWETSQELNNKNFVIEKSLTGNDYSSIATITAKGNISGGYKYSFTDNNFSNKAFYRLKQTDLNGKETIFNIVDLKNAAALYAVSVSNHAGMSRILFYNGYQNQKIQVRFTDMQGKLLSSYSADVTEGNNLLALPEKTGTGVVIINIISADGIRTSAKIGIAK